MTTPDSTVTNEQSSIEYAKIDYKNLAFIYYMLNR